MRFRQPNFINVLKRKAVPVMNMGEGTRTRRCSPGDKMRDKGNAPYAFDIANEVMANEKYRVALWTGPRLQLTIMSIPVGEEMGIEIHDDTDQFMCIQSGKGEVIMGRLPSNMNYIKELNPDYAILVPAGTYHNIKNMGTEPLKLYSIYSPKNHPFGTVDETKYDSDIREARSRQKQ